MLSKKDVRFGDFLAVDKPENFTHNWIGLYLCGDEYDFYCQCYIGFDGKLYDKRPFNGHSWKQVRFATEDEKEELIQKIKTIPYWIYNDESRRIEWNPKDIIMYN